MMLGVVMMQVV